MKRTVVCLLAPLAALLLALAAGCVSVDVASDGAKMVVVSNEGCYLFGFIPLLSGDPEYPNRDVSVIFKNTLTLETNIRLLEEEAKRQGAAGIRNISTFFIDDPIIYLLLKRKVLQTSAELTR